MRVSKYVHACLQVEDGGDKILFDPGKFSSVEGLVKPDDFRDLSAVVLTHRHPDHIDDEVLGKIAANNPKAAVLTNTEIKAQLSPQGISVEVFETERRAVGRLDLAAVTA